jgi:hypothetical protein
VQAAVVQTLLTPLTCNAGASKQELEDVSSTLSSILRSWLDEHGADSHPELQTWCRKGYDAPLQLLLYYAVFTSNSQLVDRLLDEMGHNWEGKRTFIPDSQTTPVLALAVAQHDHQMVHQLLGRGADPYTIPTEYYLQDMSEEGMHGLLDMADEPKQHQAMAASWCKSAGDKKQLQQALDIEVASGLTMCYWLARATKLPSLTSL